MAVSTNVSRFSTPPVLQQGLDFRFISCARTVSKDIVLLGAAVWSWQVFKSHEWLAEWFVVQRVN